MMNIFLTKFHSFYSIFNIIKLEDVFDLCYIHRMFHDLLLFQRFCFNFHHTLVAPWQFDTAIPESVGQELDEDDTNHQSQDECNTNHQKQDDGDTNHQYRYGQR